MSDLGNHPLDGLLDLFLNLIWDFANDFIRVPWSVLGERLHAGGAYDWMERAREGCGWFSGIRLKRRAGYRCIPRSGHPHGGIYGVLHLSFAVLDEVLVSPIFWSKRPGIGEIKVPLINHCQNCCQDADRVARPIEKDSS